MPKQMSRSHSPRNGAFVVSRYPMRPPRTRMGDIHLTGIAAIIDAAGTADPAIDDAIGGDRTGTRAAYMDLGMFIDREIVAADISRTTDIAFQLLGATLDPNIP